VLLTGGAPRYLRADLGDNTGKGSVISEEALWSPPNNLSGRYLASYLSSQVGDRADVMPQDDHSAAVDDTRDGATPDTCPSFGELSDLPSAPPRRSS